QQKGGGEGEGGVGEGGGRGWERALASRTSLQNIGRSRQVCRGSSLQPRRLGRTMRRVSQERSLDPIGSAQRLDREIRRRHRGKSTPVGAAAPGSKRPAGTLRRRRQTPHTMNPPPQSPKPPC